MRNSIKKLMLSLPLSIRKNVVVLRETYWYFFLNIWERLHYKKLKSTSNTDKDSILIYNGDGPLHSGTGKRMQLIANSLAGSFNVFFMYSNTANAVERTQNLDSRIIQIPYEYSSKEVAVPHRIYGMKPHIKNVIAENNIGYLVVIGPGYGQYPWLNIRNIPIMLCTSFGAPSMQKNLHAVVYNSITTKKHAEEWIGTQPKRYTNFTPISNWPPANVKELGFELRSKLGIEKNSFVFGRIGRDDDNIYDPIAINAWCDVVKEHTDIHYIILSPPPVLIKRVSEEKIPNVHLIPPTGEERVIWSFHGAIDCFAHFRKDGESSGVAIAESLAVGNPVISHYSPHWNSHTEYLLPTFSRISKTDDWKSYAKYMQEFIRIHSTEPHKWLTMRQAAISVAEEHFSPEKYGQRMSEIITSVQD